MRTNAKNIIALLLSRLMWLLFFFFGLLNTKGVKLGISPTDTKFKHIYMDTSHIYIEINDTYYLEPGTGLPNDQR